MYSSPAAYAIDDKDLDDAALWAVIDSAAANASSLTTASPQTTIPKYHRATKPFTPIPFPVSSPGLQNYPRGNRSNHEHSSPDVGEVVQNTHRQNKDLKTSHWSPGVNYDQSTSSPPLPVVKDVTSYCSPDASSVRYEESGLTRHSLAGQFPTVSLFKDYQNAAMAILEKSDYTMISGHAFIKKSGWRKISFYFNVSYEIKDKTIEFDDNRNVQRAEFIVRAFMQGGRFSDGWGSCERREKKFMKPNHDIPSTAETRAKNKACQDLLGIGEYRPGAGHV